MSAIQKDTTSRRGGPVRITGNAIGEGKAQITLNVLKEEKAAIHRIAYTQRNQSICGFVRMLFHEYLDRHEPELAEKVRREWARLHDLTREAQTRASSNNKGRPRGLRARTLCELLAAC